MRTIDSLLRAVVILGWLAATVAGRADDRPTTISPDGEKLAQFLDGMDVEHLWIAHSKVHWATGEPLGPSDEPTHSTHCSAFVSAACQRMKVPILSPPEHPQKLLANAQYDWLKEKGAQSGWRQLGNAMEAQALANSGLLVVAAFKNPKPDVPGHIAIVRPALKSADQIAREGPDIIQAGEHNHRQISVRHGFANHPLAFESGQIAYFAHPLTLTGQESRTPAEPAVQPRG